MPSEHDPAETPDSDEPRYVATFDPDAGERASEAVVSAVAALTGVKPVELSPLYEVVEPDALDSLVEHAQRADAGTHEVWFTYEGLDVGVRTDGQVRIRDSAVATNAVLE